MAHRSRTIHVVNLGCAKNRVDAEVMLGVAERAGFRHVSQAPDAEVILVNTCSFIDTARQESVETILELAQHKTRGTCRKLIVAGCLSQRYAQELPAELPEVDHFLGCSDMLKLAQVLLDAAPRVLVGNPADFLMRAGDPRTLSTHPGSAFVKLSEGCSRQCSFCVIPRLRGRLRSRPISDLLEEVHDLLARGVVEFNLISQDSVAYGRDLPERPTLADAVRSIADVSGVRWVRVHYLYPERLSEPLLDLWVNHPRVLPYVDLPLQHADTGILRRMRRGYDGRRARGLIERLRRDVPDVTLRSAFIVGHPGEGRAEFERLYEFVRWAQFDHLGVFCYSPEDGTASDQQRGRVSARVAESRAQRLHDLQRTISRSHNAARVGQQLDVLVEGPSDEHEWVMTGRHRGQAPEVDGVVYLSGAEMLSDFTLRPGQLRRARITQAADYDLVGEVVDG